MTGDVIQDNSNAAYEHAAALIGGLSLRTLIVPGNHDVPHLMRSALSNPPFNYCGSMTLGNWQLVGIDSCVDGVAHGQVATQEIARLRDVVAGSGADHTLVCLHHPTVAVGSRWLDAVGLRNRDQFLDQLAALGRVRGTVFGHIHQAVETTRKTIKIVGTPSTCRQFLPGSDEFAVDERPPAYRRIRLCEDGDIETELVWVADDTGDGQSDA